MPPVDCVIVAVNADHVTDAQGEVLGNHIVAAEAGQALPWPEAGALGCSGTPMAWDQLVVQGVNQHDRPGTEHTTRVAGHVLDRG